MGRERCLPLARRYVAQHPDDAVVVGLVLEAGVAYPHAWVQTAEGMVDPSVLPDDPVLRSRRYLQVPAEKAGRFFLDFFAGAARLVPDGP